jgi:hypothetical protein
MKKGVIGIIIFSIIIIICSQNVLSVFTKQKENSENNSIFNNDIKYNFPTLMEPIIVDDFIDDYSSLPVILIKTPAEFSWKNYNGKDWTTPAKNQGNCGSCWIFVATAMIESIVKIRENRPDIIINLSEQYVLSCLPAAPNNYGEGCKGGTPYHALFYIMDTSEEGNYYNGTIPESCFPYEQSDLIPCSDKCNDWINYLVPISDCGEVWVGFDDPQARETIKSMIYQNGPIAAGLDVKSDFINFGKYYHKETDYFPYKEQEWQNSLNHMVVIVGWKDDPLMENGGYWICKNSWGTGWGYNGFFNIEYGGCFIGYYTAWVNYSKLNGRPEKPSKPVGPSSGGIEIEYNFSSNSTDPENEQIYYLFNWGDGSDSGWLGPYESGETVVTSHSWNKRGTYNIKVMVKDIHEYQSEWSEPLSVTLPRNKAINNPLIQFFENCPNLCPILQKIIQRVALQ